MEKAFSELSTSVERLKRDFRNFRQVSKTPKMLQDDFDGCRKRKKCCRTISTGVENAKNVAGRFRQVSKKAKNDF